MPSIKSLGEPLLDELHQYWLDRCGDRAVPRRADIDPVDIPHLLPHIALTEVVPDDRSDAIRIRYRLAGTEIEARFGCALTNRYLDEVKEGSYLDHIMQLYEQVLAQKVPLYSENSFDTSDDEKLWAKRLMLPLSEDQKTVNMVLAGLVYVDSNPNNRATVLHAQSRFDSGHIEA
jgi:hypothetical protein